MVEFVLKPTFNVVRSLLAVIVMGSAGKKVFNGGVHWVVNWDAVIRTGTDR